MRAVAVLGVALSFAACGGGDSSQPSGSCQTATDCAGAMTCVSGKCVACRTSVDCPSGQVCVANACVSAVPCMSDTQCKSAGLVCDPAAGRCVECKTADDCGANSFGGSAAAAACLGSSCVPTSKCKSSRDCAVGVCAPAVPPAWPTSVGGMACSECVTSADCPTGAACKGNLCIKVCASAGATCGTIDGVSCGTCPSGGVCTASGTSCIKPIGGLSTFGQSIEGMVVGSDNIFVGVGRTPGTIVSVARATGKASTIATVQYLAGPVGNTDNVLWYSAQTETVSEALQSSPTNITPIYTFATGDDCYFIAADDVNLYCFDNQSSGSYFGIVQVALSGAGTPIKFGGATARYDADYMFSDGTTLFFSSQNDALIGAYPVGGGPLRALERGIQNVGGGFAGDGTSLYFGDKSGLNKLPVGGGKPTHFATLPAIGNTSWVVFAADAMGNVYAGSASGLYRINGASGQSTQLLGASDPHVLRLAVSGTSVIVATDTGLFSL